MPAFTDVLGVVAIVAMVAIVFGRGSSAKFGDWFVWRTGGRKDGRRKGK